MNEAELATIEERAAKATPGPWKTDLYLVVAEIDGGRPGGEVIIQCHPTVPHFWQRKRDVRNATFIAHAREDVPALVAEVRRLRAELQRG